jgi:hypothetical protein
MRYTDRLFELFKQVIIFYKEYNKNICVYIYLTEPLKTYEIMYILFCCLWPVLEEKKYLILVSVHY